MTCLGKFAVIMADPPWDIHMELPYGTMSDDEMRSLNIPGLQDEGLIFLWVTGRAMELGRECLTLWGYERNDEICELLYHTVALPLLCIQLNLVNMYMSQGANDSQRSRRRQGLPGLLMKGGIPRNSWLAKWRKKKKKENLVSSSKALTRFSFL